MIFARGQRDLAPHLVDQHPLDFAQHPRPEGIAGAAGVERAPVHLRPAQHGADARDQFARRSEEHTSELQSLMRISYAVFCLKKKKRKTQLQRSTTRHTSTNNPTV